MKSFVELFEELLANKEKFLRCQYATETLHVRGCYAAPVSVPGSEAVGWGEERTPTDNVGVHGKAVHPNLPL